jgi:hypothetical protein
VNTDPTGPNIGFPRSLTAMQSADLTAINIVPNADNGFKSGTIEFYQKGVGSFVEKAGQGDGTYYLGKPTVYGAIFSDTWEIYSCNMKKSITRLEVVSNLYLKKLEILRVPGLGTSMSCSGIYDTVYEKVANLTEASLMTPAEMVGYSDTIAIANNALKLKSCPLIY